MGDDELRIYREGIAEVIEHAAHGEGELAPLYRETSDRIREKLKAEADNMNALQLRQAIDDEFSRTLFKRRRIIARVIESSATVGPKTVRKTFRAVYGEESTRAQVRSSKEALLEGEKRIAGRVTVDRVSLSKRIRNWDRELGGQLATEVQKGVRARKGIEQIAAKIAKIDRVTEGLPQYLQEVEVFARAGAPELKKVAKGYLARVKSALGEMQADGTLKASPYSIRSPTQKFLRDIQKAGAADIDAVCKAYVEERAAWRAKVIARNEAVEAMRRSYVENSKNKPGVYAFKWSLSGRHPRRDECDIFANANACGLGPGVYTADKIPSRHPLCICNVTAVMDRKHFSRSEGEASPREEYADKKSPDAVGWLDQNREAAAAILGPHRHELFQRGVNVLDAEGRPVLVRDLVGRISHAAE